MLYFNFNGKFFKEQAPVIGADNRGVRYGDGLFETIHCSRGRLLLLDEHLARLWRGLKLMQFDIPRLFTPELLQQQIKDLLQKNAHTDARVRLAVIRGDGGLYDVKSHAPHYIIQSWPLAAANFRLNENGLQLCIYREAKKSIDRFSNLKHNNYLPYFMGALFARRQQCNDAVILNSEDRVADSTMANIFVVKGREILTPSLQEGCVAGVMRRHIIQQLGGSGFEVRETSISEAQILEADEVFLSNAISKIKWVASLENKSYANDRIKNMVVLLGKTKESVFC